jgi:CHAT domain-containing protein/tetratricopeptide (TPR) repeat protein
LFLAGAATAQDSKAAAPTPAETLASSLLATSDESARGHLLADHPEISRADVSAALLARGKALFQAGDTATALATFEAAAGIARSADLKPALANALYLIGVVHGRRGEIALASAALDQAEALESELGDDRHLARIWNSRGLQARQLARFDVAESYFRRSLEVFVARSDTAGQSAVWGNLGLLCENRGDFACALEAQQRSLAIDPRNSYAIHNIGALHEIQGDDALALDAYLRAAALDHEDGDAVHEAAVLVEAGRMQMHLGREPEALAAFASARTTYEKAQTPDELGDLEFALGESHLDAGRAALAVKHFEEAVRLQEPVSELHLQDSLRSLSRAQLAAGQPEAALASARRSLEIDRRLESVSALNESWVAIGEAQRKLGNLEEAREAYAEAIAAIENERDHLAGDETARQRFFEGQLRPYHRLLAFAVTGKRPEEAFRLAEQARARILVDVLQHGRSIGMRLLTSEEREREAAAETAVRILEAERAALDDVTNAAGAEMRRRVEAARRDLAATRTALFNAHSEVRLARGEAEILSPQTLLPLLEDGSAALAFTVTEDSTYAFVLTVEPGASAPPATVGLRVVSLPVGAKAWRQRVSAFRQSLAQRDFDVAHEAQALFGDLLGPFKAELKGRKSLYLVPDGPLWELPFGALQPAAGRYLIEDAALALVPSLTALVAWRTRPALPRPSESYEVLAVGESEFGSGLKKLPEATRQARAVAALYGPRSRLLVGGEATEARVKREAGQARVLHFATHGVLEPASPLYSALLLAPEPAGSADNGRLEAREILDLELPADLAVLSACETARGRIGAGEGVIGLSWALSVAGVRNTVVSLWSVDAASTADLMVSFHRRAHAGVGYAEALRAAALTLLHDPKTRHPFYWAPFVLVGDGRPAYRSPAGAIAEPPQGSAAQ